MDIFPRITQQFTERFGEMSIVWRAVTIGVVLVVGVGFASILLLNKRTDLKPASFGKHFSSEELPAAEQALKQAGLTGFQRDGQRLMVPTKDLSRYNAALLEFDALPADLGSQMLKQYENLGPFSTDRQRQQMKEALLLQEVRRMIKSVPEIEEARVAIASPERKTGWNQKNRATANVTVTSRTGREVSVTLVNSLKHVVASMVPDLRPEDVTIFDARRGEVYTGETAADSTESRYLNRAREFSRQYEQQILKALSFIPHVGVIVQVDIDSLISSLPRHEPIRSRDPIVPIANRPASIDDNSENYKTGFRGSIESPANSNRELQKQTFLVALSKSIRVSVSIPREYFHEIASAAIKKETNSKPRRDLAEIEDDVIAKVERIISRLLPDGATKEAISVTCIDRLNSASEKLNSASFANGVRANKSSVLGGAILFIGLGTLAFAMMRRAPAVTADESVKFESDLLDVRHTERLHLESNIAAAIDVDRIEALRDEIRSMIQSDAVGSTEVIDRWLSDESTEGTRKVALVLLSLEQSLAAELLGRLPQESIERITLAIANEGHVTREQQELVLNDFKADFVARPRMQPAGPKTARELLERTLDSNEAQPIQQRVEDKIQAGPFAFLQLRHVDDVRLLIEDEQPQTIALVLAQLTPTMSAQVIAGFASTRQAEILARLAVIGPTDKDTLEAIAAVLQNRMGKPPVRTGGVVQAADVIRESTAVTTASVLKLIGQKDSGLAASIRQSLFSFNDLPMLDDETLSVALEETAEFRWAIALKGCAEKLRQRIVRQFPSHLAKALRAEMSSVGPLRLIEISGVQQEIASAILALEADGRIELPKQDSRKQRQKEQIKNVS